MAWIELHQTLPTNRKTMRLKRLLKIKTPQAIGHMCMLWLWAIDNAPDGDLSSFDADDIAEAGGYTGKDPSAFVDALIGAGFVDDDGDNLHLHDWMDYAGGLIEHREERKAYKKRQYELYSDMRLIKAVRARDGDTCQYCGKTVNWLDRRGADGGTYDHVDPDGGNTLDNIVVCCRSCNSSKKHRTPAQAGMHLAADILSDSGRNTAEPQQEICRSPVEIRQKSGRNTVEKSTITVQYSTNTDTVPCISEERKVKERSPEVQPVTDVTPPEAVRPDVLETKNRLIVQADMPKGRKLDELPEGMRLADLPFIRLWRGKGRDVRTDTVTLAIDTYLRERPAQPDEKAGGARAER